MAALTRQYELPYPPSVNHYWRRVGAHTLISAAGRRYRVAVVRMLGSFRTPPLAGRLAVRLHVFPPDRRKRDLDNISKSLLDALTHAGVYADDSQIDKLEIERGDVVPSGKVLVEISERAHGTATVSA